MVAMMDDKKSSLIELAKKLNPPGQKCGEEMIHNMESFADELDRYMSKREDLDDLIGENNKELMMSNHRNHFRYLSSLAAVYDPLSFVETIHWVVRTYISHGFSEKYWQVMLPACLKIVQAGLTEESYGEVASLYEYIQVNFEDFVELARTTSSFYEELGNMGSHIE